MFNLGGGGGTAYQQYDVIQKGMTACDQKTCGDGIMYCGASLRGTENNSIE